VTLPLRNFSPERLRLGLRYDELYERRRIEVQRGRRR
jgi:hypothetical protein